MMRNSTLIILIAVATFCGCGRGASPEPPPGVALAVRQLDAVDLDPAHYPDGSYHAEIAVWTVAETARTA